MFFLHFFKKTLFPLASRCPDDEKEPRGRKKKEEKEEKNLFLRGIFHLEFRRKGNCLFTSVSKQIFSDGTFVQPPRLRARGGVSD